MMNDSKEIVQESKYVGGRNLEVIFFIKFHIHVFKSLRCQRFKKIIVICVAKMNILCGVTFILRPQYCKSYDSIENCNSLAQLVVQWWHAFGNRVGPRRYTRWSVLTEQNRLSGG